jgi:hypothetical protein
MKAGSGQATQSLSASRMDFTSRLDDPLRPRARPLLPLAILHPPAGPNSLLPVAASEYCRRYRRPHLPDTACNCERLSPQDNRTIAIAAGKECIGLLLLVIHYLLSRHLKRQTGWRASRINVYNHDCID